MNMLKTLLPSALDAAIDDIPCPALVILPEKKRKKDGCMDGG
jgi:hypothetical protein